MTVRQLGFTLTEILITVCILAIIFTLATTTYFSWKEHNEHQLFLQTFVGQLKFARSYAVSANMPVVVCPTTDKINCSSNWQDPIMIKSSTKILQYFEHPNRLIKWHSSLGKNDRLEFSALGATNAQQGTFELNSGDKTITKIIINHAGRIKTSKVK